MKNFVAVIAALTVFFISISAQEKIAESSTGTKDNLSVNVDKYLISLTKADFSGTVLIAKGDRIILHKGYGWTDKQRTTPVSIDTGFWVASISKQFAAAAILKLEEKKKIGLTDLISEYFKSVPKDKAAITIHQLLTHTSGLGQNYAADGIINRDDAVRAILKEPLKSVTGEKFNYSNDNYTLLAAIIEAASGQSYESFLRENLFRPAGMSQTGFWGETGNRIGRIAPITGKITAQGKVANWGFRGATGISSTSGDLYKWHRALLTDIVISKASREKLLKSNVKAGNVGQYAYGWFVSKTKDGKEAVWTRGNEDFGHNAIISRYSDGVVTIVLSNAGESAGVPVSRVVSAELEKIIYGNNAANAASNSE